MWLFKNRASTVLFIFLKSLENVKGKFLLPVNVCPIVPITFMKAKIDFEFIDICQDTLCIDFNKVKKRIKEDVNIIGILCAHTYGVEDNYYGEFVELKALRDSLYIIDDRCLCRPNFNSEIFYCIDLILYSSGYSKYVDMGYGGYGLLKNSISDSYIQYYEIFSRNDLSEIEKQYKKCIAQIQMYRYDNNLRWLDFDNPTISLEKYIDIILDKMKLVNEHKQKINNIYYENLPKSIQYDEKYNNWRFNLKVKNKDMLLGRIFSEKLFASEHYYPLNNIMDNSNDMFYSIAQGIYDKTINLFNDYHVTEEMAKKLCEIINKHCGSK